MTLLTQADIERQMYYGGIERATKMMQKAEDAGRAAENPYAKAILKDYVLPLASAIRIELDTKRVGRRLAHATLLAGLDPEAVAFITIRHLLNNLMQSGQAFLRPLSYAIGKAVHCELVLAQIEEENPELYHTLAADLGRRMSKSERHRMTVFKMQAIKAGIMVVEWPLGARDQVGHYLLGLIEASGMIEIEPERLVHNKVAPREVSLVPDVLEQINEIKAHVAITMPVYGPCVEPPRDWTTPTDGGFHTRELRRCHPSLVRHTLGRTPHFRNARMPVVLNAVNALQRTPWAVNARMLDIILKVADQFSVGEVASMKEKPRPAPPSWLTKETDKETLPQGQKDEFKKWKRQMADWYTDRKLAATRFSRFYAATRAATMFKEYPSIYFVYFADSRGRLYPMTYGVNPQGSDLQKALLHFAEGLPLTTEDAVKWFHVQGANKWGFDKATLSERMAWVKERADQICLFADDPINNTGWTEAGDPLQFLAWCLEFRDWTANPAGFVSRIPISMDGSCNGLQNLSALFRDEVGGAATNLVPSAVMKDIYRMVAEKATIRMANMTYDDPVKERVRQAWLAQGISRGYVKRSVMTTPYGVTKRSAVDYVIEDTLKRGEGPPQIDKEDWMRAAMVLMDHAWPAIGDVVVKGIEAMAWLKRCARAIIKSYGIGEDDPTIKWISPSGFPAIQSYYEQEVHRINTRLCGATKIRVVSEIDMPDENQHASGLAPNFVHSLDAAHLHLTADGAAAAGITALAMIHDDYGTHAANAQALYEIIRDKFVWMYVNHDPVADFVAAYPMVPTPPEKGTLDIEKVRDSEFFFS